MSDKGTIVALLATGLLTVSADATELHVGSTLVMNHGCFSPVTSGFCGPFGYRRARTLMGVGALLEVPSERRFALRLAAMYLPRGFTHLPGTRHATELSLNYLEIPLQLKSTWGSGPTRLYALGGPSLSLRTGPATADLGVNFINFMRAEEEDRNQWRGFDLSVNAGGGVQVQRGNAIFQGEAQYAYGLLNAYGGPGFRDLSRAFRLSVSAAYRLGNSARAASHSRRR